MSGGTKSERASIVDLEARMARAELHIEQLREQKQDKEQLAPIRVSPKQELLIKAQALRETADELRGLAFSVHPGWAPGDVFGGWLANRALDLEQEAGAMVS